MRAAAHHPAQSAGSGGGSAGSGSAAPHSHAPRVVPRALALHPTSAPDADGGAGAPDNAAAGGEDECYLSCGVELGWNTNFGERFTVGEELGRGSFGVVYEARHKASGLPYAVKVLPKCELGLGAPPGVPLPCSGPPAPGGVAERSPSAGGSGGGSGGGGSPTPGGSAAGSGYMPLTLGDSGVSIGSAWAPGGSDRREAIEREVAIWSTVQGSHYITRLEGLYEDDVSAYLVQELIGRGTTLKAHLAAAGGALPEADAAAVMRGALDALVEMHDRDIAYGDVKPANFLVLYESVSLGRGGASPAAAAPAAAGAAAGAGEAPGGGGGPGAPPAGDLTLSVRLVDFGCSRQVPLTRPCGSPLYMAPDMAHRRFGTAIDVWSAGVMLHQLLTGRLPFWPSKSLAQVAKLPPYAIVAAVRTHEVSYPRDLWGRVTPEARALVESMLQRDPARRATAAEALASPWFARALGYTPAPTGRAAAAAAALANRVEYSDRIAAWHL